MADCEMLSDDVPFLDKLVADCEMLSDDVPFLDKLVAALREIKAFELPAQCSNQLEYFML